MLKYFHIHIVYYHLKRLDGIIMIKPKDEQGQGLVEYALIMILVAIVVLIALALFGPAVGQLYSNIVNSI